MNSANRVTVIGHPFIPLGMGEHLRAAFRSLRSAGLETAIRDVYGLGSTDSIVRDELSTHVVSDFSDLNIFCLNGDEVEPALAHLATDVPREGVSVVYPLWELSRYPKQWAEQLSRFDEIWAPSRFTYDAIRASVSKPVVHMPLAGEVRVDKLLGRRHFGVPESSFVFLFFFDFSSYVKRKNPLAALRAFEELCSRYPSEDVCLVIKMKGGDARHGDYECVRDYFKASKNKVVVIDSLLSDVEIKSLMWCCDCFLSLHRSEGFGFGLISAMFLGKPVVATGYSGNLDFMTTENSCLVQHTMAPVPEGAYPFWEGQVWAEPDIDDAVDKMIRLVSDPEYARNVGIEASRHIRVKFSYRATGLRYLHRIADLMASGHRAAEVVRRPLGLDEMWMAEAPSEGHCQHCQGQIVVEKFKTKGLGA
jgi:glycosyltransferase involved in cell wall biosynthesis